MPEFRNTSDDTVTDYLTGRVVEPDQVIEVPDSIADFYRFDHPVYTEVGGYVPPAPAWTPPVAPPVVTAPVVTTVVTDPAPAVTETDTLAVENTQE